MRLLKQKIQASFEASQKLNTQIAPPSPQNDLPVRETRSKVQRKPKVSTSPEVKTRKRLKNGTKTPKIYLQTKNIVTNFGKAIVAFASSELALPYLITIIKKRSPQPDFLKIQDFLDFISNTKANVNSIDSFRALILEEKSDEEKIILCKSVFRMIAEIFIKYFSVNWIIHGRVTYKMMHLKFRYKMLRRIQNPSFFTYLKGYNKKEMTQKL